MKKSEELKKELEQLKAATERLLKEMVYDNPAKTPENWEDLWTQFYEQYGSNNHRRIEDLEKEIAKEERREVEVGDGVTLKFYTDRHACTVIARTKNTLTIQRDKATRDPNFKPIFVEGGFAGHCINQDEQKYTYERDLKGSIYKCYWSEQNGMFMYKGASGCRVYNGRHEFYDYNF